MRLEPVYVEEAGSKPAAGLPSSAILLTPGQQQLIGVQLGHVEKGSFSHGLRLPGRVAADESRVHQIVAKVDAWVKSIPPELTTGSFVRKGQTVLTVYSPEFLTAQQSFFVALDRPAETYEVWKNSNTRSSSYVDTDRTREEYLRDVGMGDRQITELRETRKFVRYVDIVAPSDGIVVSRGIFNGQQVVRGTEVFRTVDLSRVWVYADVHERDAQFLRRNGSAHVSWQGHSYQAKLADVAALVDPATRTMKVRLELDNPGQVLRPDMFVDVELPATMPDATFIPSGALLDSGAQKTVFVSLGNGYFEPRLVETGWRLGDLVEVRNGLEPGEEIVTAGNFLLDSESRMRAASAGVQAPASDPVCSMNVDRVKAKAAGRISRHQGQDYYFCNDSCKKEFDSNPGKYLSKDRAVRQAQLHPGAGGSQTASSLKDPICDMDVDIATARAAGRVSRHGGHEYFFCNDYCKKEFDSSPGKWLKQSSSAQVGVSLKPHS